MTSPNQTPDALRETVEKVHEKYQEDWNRAYDLNGDAVANGYPPPGGYPNLVDRLLTAVAPFLAPPPDRADKAAREIADIPVGFGCKVGDCNHGKVDMLAAIIRKHYEA